MVGASVQNVRSQGNFTVTHATCQFQKSQIKFQKLGYGQSIHSRLTHLVLTVLAGYMRLIISTHSTAYLNSSRVAQWIERWTC